MNVTICTSCDGEGEKRIRDYYGEWSVEKCTKCNGTGRLWTRTYAYHVPFDFNKHKIYKVDERIINLIRDLEKND
jgi:DnaJ-class molecular chaperone with C-terminal Zn finger domain